jgi:hypothetical protein
LLDGDGSGHDSAFQEEKKSAAGEAALEEDGTADGLGRQQAHEKIGPSRVVPTRMRGLLACTPSTIAGRVRRVNPQQLLVDMHHTRILLDRSPDPLGVVRVRGGGSTARRSARTVVGSAARDPGVSGVSVMFKIMRSLTWPIGSFAATNTSNNAVAGVGQSPL